MKRILYVSIAVAALLAMSGCTGKVKRMDYPQTRQDSSVVDNYHGVEVADPYRWLEDDNSDETAAWVGAQNRVTFDYLSRIPFRDKVRERLTQLWNYPKDDTPYRLGDYRILGRNDGLQNQNILYIQDMRAGGEPEVLIDPNKLSEDGTVALRGIYFSKDYKHMAYSLSTAGSDWSEIRVMGIPSRSGLPDVIRWVKFTGVAWHGDGFFYSGYDEPDRKGMLSAVNRGQKIFFHRLGDDQSQDKLIYEDPANPLRYYKPVVSEDGRWLFIDISQGTSGSEIIYRDLSRDGSPFRVLFPGFESDYLIVECADDKVWALTNRDAPNFRLIQADLTKPSTPTVDIIPEDDGILLESVSSVGGYLMAVTLDKASNRAWQYDMQGKLLREVALPPLTSVSGFAGRRSVEETFYSVTGFLSPKTNYRYDLATGESELFSAPQLTYDPEKFTVRQVFYPSRDSTMVSMFVMHRKDLKLDGKNPALLYGYGGFNVNLTPGFNPSAIMFMEQGGVYAMANLRGGGEYGEKWHRAGMLAQKQNVFDDFIAAAEWLIDNKYTSSSRLAIHGGSNGGLLVGAAMTQRPELFAVALPAVGVLDMLRYQKFTIGWGWVVEYGSSDDARQFEYLYKYSPLHNLRPGTCYPATLITTADHDDRVVPAHSFKFAAALQQAQGCDNPVLIRIDTNAGHGAGKPTSKRIEEAADIYSFVFRNTGTKVKF